MKNTVCLTKGRDAFVGPHIGDMENAETQRFHREVITHLRGLLRVKPKCIVRDLHPDFGSSRSAERLGRERHVPVYALQHHYAHAHAVLAEYQYLDGAPALVWALDGAGLGEDGSLWGGELLLVDAGAAYRRLLSEAGATGNGACRIVHERLSHFPHLLLPGGDAAAREPWRIAHQLLDDLGLLSRTTRPLPWLPERAAVAAALPRMVERGLNTPKSSSCGRLFDAVSALLGLCSVTTYEGQAAIRLEEAQYAEAGCGAGDEMHYSDWDEPYPCPVIVAGGLPLPDTRLLFETVWRERQAGVPVFRIARRFHAGLAEGLAALAAEQARPRGIQYIGLTGGSLQNKTLARLLCAGLRRRGCIPLQHRLLPPGDGCISLGQAAWGCLRTVCGGKEVF